MLRKEYMESRTEPFTYYKQFATPTVMQAVRKAFGPELKNHTYPFSGINLSRWADLSSLVPDELFYQHGDIPSVAGRVCVLKAAAKLVKEETQDA